ncbi:MAG: renalase, partial [Abditibacteriota bacterium]|nr:renalase [Abditibacteriota bacterium]
MNSIESCLIIGAGLSGLTAAHALSELGVRATVLEKGHGVGGRLATRRLKIGEQSGTSDSGTFDHGTSDSGTFDHGAQFFTVRSDEFREVVERWRKAGIA